jgi:hypothetical protein
MDNRISSCPALSNPVKARRRGFNRLSSKYSMTKINKVTIIYLKEFMELKKN